MFTPTQSQPNPLTPVTLLTGFLGSGKTTLLNRLLQSPDLHDTAVLINEYGEVPIDHLLVRAASDNITVLANGCICCSVAGDMVNALRDLYFKRSKGEVPHFRRVVIETTGLADPAPIMHTLIEMPLVAARYTLSGIITTIDVVHGEQQLNTHTESLKQIAVADRIVITKADLASPDTLAALRTRLAKINPGAKLFEAVLGNINPDHLFDTGLYQADDKTPDVRKWLNAEAYRPLAAGNRSQTQARPVNHAVNRAAPLRHDERFATFCVRYTQPVIWDELVHALEMIQAMRGDNLLRVKGIINVANENQPRVIHVVQHTIYPSAKLSTWPDEDHDSRLVFIVKDLDADFVVDALADFLQQTPDNLASANIQTAAVPA